MADGVNLGSAYGEIKIGTEGAQSSLDALSQTMASVGEGLKGALTDPIMGVGQAAIAAGTQLNEGLANIQSLGLTQDRVLELKGSIQDLSIATGKGTTDMAEGLYMVESAFGDSADTASILEINAKSAAAGLASTTDAINLTSAVTKGFGDTTKEAVQHTSDLALKTVELGQTTFPQLASSIGLAVPLATQLAVSQEELFAVMATGSGVTGTTGQVATQLRGILQSLMVPTASMTTLFGKMGVTSGEALIKQEGLQGAIQAVVAAAEQSGEPLQSYMGSVEGQTLALTLAGPQAEKYASNLLGMASAAGKTDAAFDAQTKGLNAGGFAMQQAQAKMEVFYEKIYDGLGPALAVLADLVSPVVDRLLGLSDWFSSASPTVQTFIVVIAGIAAAIGPVMIAISAMLPALAGVGAALGLLAGPIGLIILALGALYLAWTNNFLGIQDVVTGAIAKITGVLTTVSPAFHELVAQITGIGIEAYDTTEGIESFVTALGFSQETATAVGTKIADLGMAIYGYQSAIADAGVSSTEARESLQFLLTTLGVSDEAAESASRAFQSLITRFTEGRTAIQQFGSSALGELGAQLLGINENAYDTTEAIYGLVEGLTGSSTAATAVADGIFNAGTTIREMAATVRASWEANWPAISAALTTAAAAIQAGLQTIGTLLSVGFSGAMTILQTVWNAAWAAMPTAIATARAAISLALAAINTFLTTTLPGGLNTLAGLWAAGWARLSAAVTTVQSTVGPIITTLSNSIQTALPGALTSLQVRWQSVWSVMPGVISTAMATISTSITTVTSTIQTTWAAAWVALPGAIESARATITLVWGQIEQIFGPSVGRIVAAFQPMVTGLAALGPQFTALGAAAMPVLELIRNGAMLVAAVIGVVLLAAMNALAGVMQNLPAIVSVVVTQMTATLNLISGVVNGVVHTVQALLSGNWAAAWESAKGVVSTLGTFVNTTLAGLRNTVVIMFSIIGTTITNTLKDLGFTAAAAAVQSVIDKVTSLVTTLSGLASGDIKIAFTPPEWLATWTASLTTTPAWAESMKTSVAGFATSPTWVATLATIQTAIASAPGWIATIKATVDKVFGSPDWVAVIDAAFTAIFATPGWVTAVKTAFDSIFKTPGWITTISNSITTLFGTPGWITTFQTVVNGLLGWVPKLPELPFGLGEAGGSSYMQGGALRGINERGMELVSIPRSHAILPPGSKVYTNGQSNRMMAGGGGGDVHIHLDGIVIRSDQDINSLAFQLGQKTKWEMGRG